MTQERQYLRNRSLPQQPSWWQRPLATRPTGKLTGIQRFLWGGTPESFPITLMGEEEQEIPSPLEIWEKPEVSIAMMMPTFPVAGIPKATKIGQQIVKNIQPIKPVVKPLVTDLTNFTEIARQTTAPDIARKISNLPVLRNIARVVGGPAAVIRNAGDTALVGRAKLQYEGMTKTQGIIAGLDRLGSSKTLFNLADDGTVKTGVLKGIHLNDIRTYPTKYMAQLDETQQLWIKQAQEIEQAKLEMLKRNSIPIRELSFEEGGQYAGRRVYAKISTEGELLDTAYVGGGVGRVGGKMAAEKARIFPSAEEALKQGYRYLSEEEALYFNTQSAYNRVADKMMTNWFLKEVPWRTAKAKGEAVLQWGTLRAQKQALNQMVQVMQRIRGGMKVIPQSWKGIKKWFPDQYSQLYQTYKTKGAIPQELDTFIAQTKQELSQKLKELRPAYRVAREQAGKRWGEAIIPHPAFGGKIFTGSQAKELAQTFAESFNPQYLKAIDSMNKVNAIGRFFMLAGDASPFTIQLLFLAGASPRIYTKSFGGFVQALFNPRFLSNYYVTHAKTISEATSLVLARGGTTEFTELMARGGFLRSKPLKWGGKILEPFSRAFEAALDVAGIEMREAFQHLATTPARAEQLETFINEFRGLTASSRLGISRLQRQVETASLLAPRYNRAIAALLGDIFRGNLRGDLARKSLAKGITALSAMGVAVSLALEEDMDEILDHFNPTSENFFTWQIAGQKIGPGGKVRQVLRLAGQITEKPESLLEPQKGGYLWANPLLRFVRSNLAPVPSTGLDILTGADYIGDPTRDGLLNFSKRLLAQNLLPIWLEESVLEPGGIDERLLRGVAQFFGLRAYPEKPSRRKTSKGQGKQWLKPR